MKVTYQTCCGVDVHKSFLVATIIETTNNFEPSYQKKRFTTCNHSILKFKNWILKNHCYDVYLESTGKYWIPTFNLLEDDINVTIAHPKWVKAVKDNKTIRKVLNGLEICPVLDLFATAIFPVKRFIF